MQTTFSASIHVVKFLAMVFAFLSAALASILKVLDTKVGTVGGEGAFNVDEGVHASLVARRCELECCTFAGLLLIGMPFAHFHYRK